jgi:hypothetical protein
MLLRPFVLAPIAASIALLLAGLNLACPAFGHEQRVVGEYELVVGFLNEPALLNQPNGVDLRVTHAGEQDEHADEEEGEHHEGGEPVEGLDQTLQAEVIVGGGAQSVTLEFSPVFGEPGAYAARFIPTLEGEYTFRIFGSIEGMEIDESFTSGPETFSSVESLAPLQFPEQVPTNQELAAQIAGLDTGGKADTALIVALVSLLVALIALGIGAYAVARRPRP